MNLRWHTLVTILALGISLFPWHEAMAAERLGLHVTQEELDIWRQRAVSGPYKTDGDVSNNSPGDWNRILNQANAFLSNPSAERWKGQVTPACRENGTSGPNVTLGDKLRDAAFVYLITEKTIYRDAVRKELLAQAEEIGTNFADRKRWCLGVLSTQKPTLQMNTWLTKFLFGYDYIRSSLTQAQRQTLDTWFLNAGLFLEIIVTEKAKAKWPNRDQDDYTYTPIQLKPKAPLYFGGPTFYIFHSAWTNTKGSVMRVPALVGIMLDNDFLKKSTKRFYKETLRYNVWPDGAIGDMHRFTQKGPCVAWGYSGATLAPMVVVADHFARIGDFELYEYTTSEGYGGTEGGPKSIEKTLLHYQDYIDHTVKRYGTTDKSKVGNSAYLIDSECDPGANPLNPTSGSWSAIHDVWSATQANIYFNNPHITDVYLRRAPNTPPYPSNPSGVSEPWGGQGGIYAGVLFMFGNMEGKVWPYPGLSGDKVPPGPPVNLRIQ